MEYSALLMMVVTFLQERRLEKDRNIQSLKDYLQEKNFTQVLEYLEENRTLQNDIETLLQTELSELNAKIETLTNTLTTVASSMSGFENIVPVSESLSKQAIKVLIETESREEGVLLIEHEVLAIAPWYTGSIPVEEPRFLEEDIRTLQSFGWISRFSENNFRITRNGVKASKILKESTSA